MSEIRLRIRGPSGLSTASLPDDATVRDLRAQIVEKTGLATYDVKYGYPVKSLLLDEFEQHQNLAEVGVKLNGEVLIITPREGATAVPPAAGNEDPASNGSPPSPKLSLSRNQKLSDDPPEVASPEHGGTFVLRVMPDDNSCLFRAVSTALLGGEDAMTELRSVVAEAIQNNPNEYPKVVLEKEPDEYCRWIKNENSWGGAIELSILSKHFDIEICSIDVQSLAKVRFNEGQSRRCVLVYSGIHYDTIALTPEVNAPPEFDQKVFDAEDLLVEEKSVALCKLLQGQHYYTDTASFRIKCNRCGGIFTGEQGATKHANETGHDDFQEAS
ncbi:ubiquitin-specific protease OTU1 [Aspergillus lucknowensis]|uniref:Ubiquitin thioesterase OTU n=1 Tax=Aspergillus lucknowensis TaxID=176173 RepID=A0ABR4LHK0_9EURO